MNKTMQFSLNDKGVLVRDDNGNVPVQIIENQTEDGRKTAAIVFGGETQGFACFDSNQNKPISVIPSKPSQDPNLDESLYNICKSI